MTETELLPAKTGKINEKKCFYTVGTYSCLHCVSEGKCPSKFTRVEQIGKVESGREYCLGGQ